MDKLSELQAQAKEDLIILDDEDLHQQSYKNQIIKPKWLDYKSKYRMLMFQTKAQHANRFLFPILFEGTSQPKYQKHWRS